MSDRSQLLIDIERGTSLKKVSQSQNGLNTRYMNHIRQVSSTDRKMYFFKVFVVSGQHDAIWFIWKMVFIEKNDLILSVLCLFEQIYFVIMALGLSDVILDSS